MTNALTTEQTTMEQLLKSIIQKSPKIDDEKLSKDDNEEIEAELRKLGYL